MHCPDIDPVRLARLWNSEMKSDRICLELGITRGHLYHLARKHVLGRRPPQFTAARCTETPDPSEAEIAERAAAIRATWTAAERRARMVGSFRAQRFEVPHYYFDREEYSFSS